MDYDLTAAVKQLRRTKDGKRIASLIEGVNGLWSVARDLERVEALLDLHMDIDEQGPKVASDQDPVDAFVGQSLQVNAVLHYCRATHSSSKVRSTIQLRPKLSDNDWQKHRALCALRDDAIAHHGPGPDSERSWIEEKLVVRFEDGAFRIIPVFTRANYLAWVSVALHDLLPQVQAIVDSALAEKQNLLVEAIVSASDVDGVSIISQGFSAADFFRNSGDPEVFMSPEGGQSTTWRPRGK